MKRRIIPIVATLILSAILIAATVMASATATRDIADTTLNPGESTSVTVTINPVGETTILLVEEVPAGWVISSASSTGATLPILNAATGEFVFLNIDGSDLGTLVLTYTLTVPLGTSAGAYATVGTVKDGDENVLTTVGGDTSITVGGVPSATTATRDIADTTLNAGDSTGVTVTINPVGETTILLVEEVPAGWVISSASSTGATLPILNAATGEFVFLNIDGSDLGTLVLTYTLTVPVGTSDGTYPIVGTVKDGGENILTTVGGDTTITVGGVPSATTATRNIVNTSLNAGGSTGVTVTITPVGETTILLLEEVPAGWVISSASSTGSTLPILNAAAGEFVFLNIDGSDLGTLTLTYTLTVPVGTSDGTYAIVGTVKDGGENILTTVGGDTTITVAGVGVYYTLTMAVSPTGSGTTTPSVGTYSYAADTVVPLIAAEASGYDFSYWSGGAASSTSPTTTVTMNADKNITANFVEETGPPAENFAWWLYETFVEPFMYMYRN